MNDEYVIVGGELYHYGVPGMRWGHKKGPSLRSTQPRKRMPGEIDENPNSGRKPHKNVAYANSKKTLTPAQQKARIERGKSIAAGVLAGVGTVAVTAVAVKYAKKKKRGAEALRVLLNNNAIKNWKATNAVREAYKQANPISSRIWKV